MPKPQKSTWLTKEQASAQRAWFLADVEGKTLGRAATQIASILRGKHKPTYTPNVDSGDFVVVVNAAKVKLSGAKLKDKLYRSHSGYIGSLKETSAGDMLATHPDRVIKAAVWGMLPNGTLGKHMLKKLKIYSGAEHNHSAQNPQPLEL